MKFKFLKIIALGAVLLSVSLSLAVSQEEAQILEFKRVVKPGGGAGEVVEEVKTEDLAVELKEKTGTEEQEALDLIEKLEASQPSIFNLLRLGEYLEIRRAVKELKANLLLYQAQDWEETDRARKLISTAPVVEFTTDESRTRLDRILGDLYVGLMNYPLVVPHFVSKVLTIYPRELDLTPAILQWIIDQLENHNLTALNNPPTRFGMAHNAIKLLGIDIANALNATNRKNFTQIKEKAFFDFVFSLMKAFFGREPEAADIGLLNLPVPPAKKTQDAPKGIPSNLTQAQRDRKLKAAAAVDKYIKKRLESFDGLIDVCKKSVEELEKKCNAIFNSIGDVGGPSAKDWMACVRERSAQDSLCDQLKSGRDKLEWLGEFLSVLGECFWPSFDDKDDQWFRDNFGWSKDKVTGSDEFKKAKELLDNFNSAILKIIEDPNADIDKDVKQAMDKFISGLLKLL